MIQKSYNSVNQTGIENDFERAAVLFLIGFVAVFIIVFAVLNQLEGAYFPGTGATTGQHVKAWLLSIVSSTDTAQQYSQHLHNLERAGILWALYVRAALSFAIACGVGVLLFLEQYSPRNNDKHIKGRRYADGKKALKIAQQATKSEIENDVQGLMLADALHISRKRECNHFLIMGAIGSGKTVIAKNFLNTIFKRNDRALIVDWKGDFTQAYDGAIFNPLDSRSMRWHIAKDVATELDAEAFAGQLSKTSPKDPFWGTAAREVGTALIIKCQRTKPNAWNFADLLNELAAGFENIQAAILVYRPSAAGMIEEKSKQTQSILSQLITDWSVIQVLAKADAADPTAQAFSITEWLATGYKGRKQIILGASLQYQTISEGYLCALITATAARLADMPDSRKRRVWIVADEMPLLGHLPALETLVQVGRSKGARLVMFVQDINQVSKIYSHETAKSLLTSVGTTIIGRTSGGDTADYISKTLIGMRRVERRIVTVGENNKKSISHQQLEIPVVYPSELQSELGEISGKGINAIVLGLGDNALNLHWAFSDTQQIRPARQMRACFMPGFLDKTTHNIDLLILPSTQENDAKPVQINGLVTLANMPLLKPISPPVQVNKERCASC